MIKVAKKKPVAKNGAQQAFLDKKNMGDEPKLTKDATKTQVISAFNYYNYMDDPTKTVGYLAEHIGVVLGDRKLALYVGALHYHKVNLSISRIARMMKVGQVPEELEVKLADYVETLRKEASKNVQQIKETITKAAEPKKTFNKADAYIADIDDFIDTGEPFSVYEYLKTKEAPKYVSEPLLAKYEPILAEVKAAYDKEDKDLVHAYKIYTRKDLKDLLSRIELLVEDVNRFADNKKIERKPRKKKVVSKTSLLKHFKPLMSYDPLKIVSVNPESVLDASEVYAYNVKYKTLNHFVAKDGAKLSVHRTSIINYDETKSRAKKIGRKEKEIIQALLSAGKVAARKTLDMANTGFIEVSDRVSDQVLVLKVFK